MFNRLILRPEFSIDCYEQEDLDDYTSRYHIALAACGVRVRTDGAWETWRALVEGHAVNDGKRAWLDWDRPIKHPIGMDLIDAHHVLIAAFNHLGRGSEYDGDLTSMPIDLGFWLAEHLTLAVAHTVERALRDAVAAHNAAGRN